MNIVQKQASIFVMLLVIVAITVSIFTERNMVSFCEDHDGISEMFVLTTREARIYWRNKQEVNHANNKTP